ncbi:hypothetical protein [Pontibacillus litoralis]|nr:hypothetical protein [Pontibacillus litoralis]
MSMRKRRYPKACVTINWSNYVHEARHSYICISNNSLIRETV